MSLTTFGLRTVLIGSFVLALVCPGLQAQMLQQVPGQPPPQPIPSGVYLNADDWMQSVLAGWTPEEVSAWNSLEPSFIGGRTHRLGIRPFKNHRERFRSRSFPDDWNVSTHDRHGRN